MMKNTCKSPLDVFEFKDEDEEEVMITFAAPAKNTATSKLQKPRANGHVARDTEIRNVICGLDDTALVDCNLDATGSLSPLGIEDYAWENAPDLKDILPNNFKSFGEDAKIEYIDGPGSAFCGAEFTANPRGTSFLEDESVRWNSVTAEGMSAAESMSRRSPYAFTYSDASDGPLSENCFTGWDLGDDGMRISFYPDYIEYCGMQYLDSVVSFSRSSLEVKSKTIYGNKGTFDVRVEIEDIVKIESQWSAHYETGTICIYFISKDTTQDEIVSNTSGIQELKLGAVDPNWYAKKEAIESLDVRYKALWSVLLDTGMEKFSDSPEAEAIIQPSTYFPNFDKPCVEVIFPKGDPDAVSISKRDIDLLQPDTFVNDTIIDFYIKYLRTRQNVEERNRFHFFNSFFFRKLADMDKDPSSAFDGNAAFQRVRKWTRKVNVLEKDFIFVPVNYNYHWSLIVICYFGEVASYRDVEDDKSVRVPCILHMDSIRGSHVGVKDLMQSYLWEEWKERQKETCEDVHLNFRNLKFVSLELPRQQNSYDCGLFLLHYVERFLEEVPANFSIYTNTTATKFLQADWFPPDEASVKRSHIQRLIHDLLETRHEDCSPSSESNTHCSLSGPKTTHGCENGVDISEKDGSLMGFHGTSECPNFDQGIEMTLLPSSTLKRTECSRSSELVLKELFMPGSATEAVNVIPSEAINRRISNNEFKQSVPLTQDEELAEGGVELSQAVTPSDDDDDNDDDDDDDDDEEDSNEEECKSENMECSTVCFTSEEIAAEISNQNDNVDAEKHFAKRMKIEIDGDERPEYLISSIDISKQGDDLLHL